MEIRFLTALEDKADMIDWPLGLGYGERLLPGLHSHSLTESSHGLSYAYSECADFSPLPTGHLP